MYTQLFPFHPYYLHPIYIITTTLLLLLIIPVHLAQEYDKDYYFRCKNSTSLICGNTTLEMVYPFWGGDRPPYCGLEGYELKCVNDIPIISIGTGPTYRVVEIDPSTSGLILERYDDDLIYLCSTSLNHSTILNQNLFSYGMSTVDLYVYDCGDSGPPTFEVHFSIPPTFGVRNNYTCMETDGLGQLVWATQIIFGMEFLLQDYLETLDSYCGSPVRCPVDRKVVEEFADDVKLQREELWKPSFKIHYINNKTACSECERSGGLCWRNTNSAYSRCLYEPSGETQNLRLKIGVGAGGVAVISILFLVLLFFICYRRMKARHSSASYPKDVEAFIRKYGSSVPKRYRYSALKKITNSFKDELGKGGYGNVYKGCLSDGRLVAVKVLNATKGNGEDFMNEVASIGRTSHVNVVTLIGFVYESKKRALIYEFMPNGSLEKFIYGATPTLKEQYLSWEKLYNIALGIARGLEYLHCGCSTHILHLDIKPHNILLDEDFCPKISDFGLAKLYTRKESMVSSIMQARGTIGYIAPEVFSRNFGQVSHKSDVYSYGMMILEMVGGRKNVDTRVARTSEIYFPRWVYKHIHVNEETSSADNITEEENHIAKKMMIVGLWCIQTNPSQRPSISKVIEMFEGNLAALDIPPKPYLCSPPTSPSNSQQTTLSRSSSRRESNSSPKLVSRSNK